MFISYVYCIVNKCYTNRIPEIFLTSHKVQININVYKYKCIYYSSHIYDYIICLLRIILSAKVAIIYDPKILLNNMQALSPLSAINCLALTSARLKLLVNTPLLVEFVLQ